MKVSSTLDFFDNLAFLALFENLETRVTFKPEKRARWFGWGKCKAE